MSRCDRPEFAFPCAGASLDSLVLVQEGRFGRAAKSRPRRRFKLLALPVPGACRTLVVDSEKQPTIPKSDRLLARILHEFA